MESKKNKQIIIRIAYLSRHSYLNLGNRHMFTWNFHPKLSITSVCKLSVSFPSMKLFHTYDGSTVIPQRLFLSYTYTLLSKFQFNVSFPLHRAKSCVLYLRGFQIEFSRLDELLLRGCGCVKVAAFGYCPVISNCIYNNTVASDFIL